MGFAQDKSDKDKKRARAMGGLASAAHNPKANSDSAALVATLLGAGGAPVPFVDATKDAPKAAAKKEKETPKALFERLKRECEAAHKAMVEAESKDERIERLIAENRHLSHVGMLLERRCNELEITARSQASLIGPPQYQEAPKPSV